MDLFWMSSRSKTLVNNFVLHLICKQPHVNSFWFSIWGKIIMKISTLEFGIYIYIYIFFSFAFLVFPAWPCFFNLRQSCNIIKFLFKLVHLFLVLSACYLCVIYWIIINILILNVVTIERWGSLLLLFFYYFFPFLHHWPAIATLHSWIVCGSVVPTEIGSKETSQPTANKSTPKSQIGAPATGC